MSSKTILIILVITLFIGIAVYQNRQSSSGDSIQNALTRASKEQKIVFIKVGESWCPPCVKMEEILSTDPKLQELLKKFVFVKTGLNNPEIQDWKVDKIPFLMFYTPEGKEITRHTGFLKAEDMIAFLEKILDQRK